MRPGPAHHATKQLTQAQQAAQVITRVWGCTDKMARDLDADRLCAERGITDKAKRLDVINAVAARKGRL